MKLTLVEHGGWGALLKRQPVTIDTDALPADVADELRALAAAAERARTQNTDDPSPRSRAPEGMTYEIIVEREGHTVTLRGSDLTGSPEFNALQQAVRQQARLPHGPADRCETAQ